MSIKIKRGSRKYKTAKKIIRVGGGVENMTVCTFKTGSWAVDNNREVCPKINWFMRTTPLLN